LDQVSGDVTVLIDGDLQDPPEAIPILLDSYRQGYDVV
jgi:polyisoprenyl-phosphate glycosyltransferase